MGPFLERGFSFRANSRTGTKNWPISRTGYQFQGNFVLEQGANLESRAAHTHPKNTQVPPRVLKQVVDSVKVKIVV